MIRKVIVWAVAMMVILAIWRTSGGTIEGVFNAIWAIIEGGADVVRHIWDAIIPIAGDAVKQVAPTETPVP
jgi:phage-related protein